MAATKKRSAQRRAKKRTARAPQKSASYKGLFILVGRAATTKTKKKVAKGRVLYAVGDPGSDGWVPVLVDGRLDHVQRADVTRIVPKRIPRPSTSQQEARKRLVKRAGVKVTPKDAERIRAQWGS
jgi:hypothetical protein